jgi:hypothetical protein
METQETNNLSTDDLKNKIVEMQGTIDAQKLQIEEARKALQEGSEYNNKLAYCARLFAEIHLTAEEKIAIAQEFERALSIEQVERIYKKYYTQVRPDGVDLPEDFIWSPGFIRDLEKYYFHYRGYNPFTIIDESIQNIRNQFMIEDDISVAESDEKIAELRVRWENNRMLALRGVDDIISTTNDFMRK